MISPAIDILIVGVGGQGTLLSSRLLGALAMTRALDVKVSEVHGMAQRGGSVVTHVRVGARVLDENGNEAPAWVPSPLVSRGEADYLMAFEPLEAARYAAYLKRGGVLIVNTRRVPPVPVLSGAMAYPDDPLAAITDAVIERADALALAEEAGSARAMNVALMGMLSRHLPFTADEWHAAIASAVPEKALAVNLRAFAAGRAAGAASV